jgi:hypothetical protein
LLVVLQYQANRSKNEVTEIARYHLASL